MILSTIYSLALIPYIKRMEPTLKNIILACAMWAVTMFLPDLIPVVDEAVIFSLLVMKIKMYLDNAMNSPLEKLEQTRDNFIDKRNANLNEYPIEEQEPEVENELKW